MAAAAQSRVLSGMLRREMPSTKRHALLAAALALGAAILPACAVPGPKLDGLHVVNGGSTNAAGWEIALRSDASAAVRVAGSPTRVAHFRSDLVARTFVDVKAARNSGAAGKPCMKSVSFGSVTRVRWHTWASPDLNCPQNGPALAALAADVAELQAQARLVSPQRRIVPSPEVRRAPPAKGR